MNEMGGACSTCVGEGRCTQVLVGKTDATWKTQA